MKKNLSLLLLLIVTVAFIADDANKKLNGAYQRNSYKFGDMKDWEIQKDQKITKIFADGYWITFYYDDKRPGIKIFSGAGGGTYTLKNNKYQETLDFYSWDSTAVGKTFELDYEVTNSSFKQFGFMNSEKYQNYAVNEKFDRISASSPLKNKKLEGVWEMTEGTWGGESRYGVGKYKDAKMVVIFQYPKMALAYYFPKTKTFDGAGLYSYQFDGKIFTEANEAYSWDENHIGTSNDFLIKFEGKTLTKTSSINKGYKEVYKKISK